jgi:hypothetical protein
MLNEAHNFLLENVDLFFRMEKTEDKIVIFERKPNSLLPYQENCVFDVSFVKIDKYN